MQKVCLEDREVAWINHRTHLLYADWPGLEFSQSGASYHYEDCSEVVLGKHPPDLELIVHSLHGPGQVEAPPFKGLPRGAGGLSLDAPEGEAAGQQHRLPVHPNVKELLNTTCCALRNNSFINVTAKFHYYL